MENKNNNSQSNQSKISVCDIMKDNTSQVIRKLESQIPAIIQNHSDMYASYLHMYDDLFGTCYLSEKEFFDKLDINQETLEQIKKNSDAIKEMYLENIDTSTKYLDSYAKMQISAAKFFDNYIHATMQTYSNCFSQFTKIANP